MYLSAVKNICNEMRYHLSDVWEIESKVLGQEEEKGDEKRKANISTASIERTLTCEGSAGRVQI